MALVLFLATVLLLISGRRLRKSTRAVVPPRNGLCTASIVLVTGLALYLTLVTNSAGQWRLRLSQVRYRVPQDSSAISPTLRVRFGADAEKGDFLLPQLPDSFCSVRWEEGSSPRVVYHPTSSGTHGVVALRDDTFWSRRWRFLGEVPLQVGDVIEIPLSRDLVNLPLESSLLQPGTLEVTVASDDALRVGNIVVDIPRPTFRLPPLDLDLHNPLIHRDAFGRTFPVQQILESVRAAESGDYSGALLPEGFSLFSSFLFYHPSWLGLRGELHLALLDESIRIRRGDKVIGFQPSFELPASSATSPPAKDGAAGVSRQRPIPSVQIHFLGLGRRSPVLRNPLEWGGLRDLRSGRLRLAPDRRELVFQLDTPEELTFSSQELEALRLTSDPDRTETRLYHLTLVRDALADKAISFSILPIVFASGQAILEAENNNLRLLTPAGELGVRFGRGFWLGDNPQALVQVDRVGATWELGLLVFCLVIAALALRRFAHLDGSGFDTIWSATLLLLLLRFLFAFKAFNRFPASVESLELSIWSLALIPWSLIALWQALSTESHRPEDRSASPHVVYAAAVMPLCWLLFRGAKGWAGVLFALAVLGLSVFSRRPEQRRTIRSWCAIPGRFSHHLPVGGRVGWRAAFMPGVALMALRLLPFAGLVRERVSIGPFAIALSILYTPLLLYGYARLATYWRFRRHQPAFVYLLSIALFLSFSLVLVGIIASDFGIPLLLSIPILVHLWVERASLSRVWRIAILVPILCYVAPTALAGQLGSLGLLEFNQPSRVSWDNNWLRFLQLSYPDSLKEIGRRDSDNLAIMSETLYNYRHSGWLGKGYLGTDVTALLGPTVLREHVPVVFLASEFGMVGTVALLILYLVPVLSWAPLSGHGSTRLTLHSAAGHAPPEIASGYFWRLLGWLCLLTFGAASIYMILANYGWVLFTGKNAYLLGLDSFGDVLEGWVLLAVALVSQQMGCRGQEA